LRYKIDIYKQSLNEGGYKMLKLSEMLKTQESKEAWETPKIEELQIGVTLGGINPTSQEPTTPGGVS